MKINAHARAPEAFDLRNCTIVHTLTFNMKQPTANLSLNCFLCLISAQVCDQNLQSSLGTYSHLFSKVTVFQTLETLIMPLLGYLRALKLR